MLQWIWDEGGRADRNFGQSGTVIIAIFFYSCAIQFCLQCEGFCPKRDGFSCLNLFPISRITIHFFVSSQTEEAVLLWLA